MRNFVVTVDGKKYEVSVEEVGAQQSVAQPVYTAPVEKKETPAAPKAQNGNGTAMKSPMPGMIAGFKVSDGATVKKGQPVIVLEAMKMENDLTAPCDGVISFKVSKGANVDTGAVIAVIA